MSITISVTLDDSAVSEFLDLYNKNADVKITADMLNQNDDLHRTIATDMVNAWFDWTLGEDFYLDEENNTSVYNMYSQFFEPFHN